MISTVQKNDIRNLSLDELAAFFEGIGEKPFRAVQVFEWICKKGADSFAKMANLPAPLRKKLEESFDFKPLQIAMKQVAKDGTTKFLFDLADREKIETVPIPSDNRSTVCITTQAGCKFGCRFCASGIGGWKRHLSCAEILSQILRIKEEAKQHANPLSHIVCMGTGEPFPTVRYYG